MKAGSILLPVSGFAPDAAPDAPGLRECDGFLPTVRGMKTAPVPVDVDTVGLPSDVIGMDTIDDNFFNQQLYAGTASNLYVLNGSTWNSISRAGGYSPAVGGISRWHFLQFGNTTLAVTKDVQIQSRTSGNFADLATAPRAEIVERVGLFVIAFNVFEVGFGDHGDGWWCCGISNVTQWTPSVSTEANNGRLYATPGNIVAAKVLGSRIVAYKESGAYVGTYTGPPTTFKWELSVGDEGALGADAVALIYPGGRPTHFVVGPQRMFLFDGYRAQLLGVGEVSEWFYSRLSVTQRHRTKCVVEPAKNLVHIYYFTNSANDFDSSLVYNYVTNRWGVGRTCNAREVFQYVDVAIERKTRMVGYLKTGVGTIQSVNGEADQSVISTLRTQTYGADDSITYAKRIRPRVVGDSYKYTADLIHKRADGYDGVGHADTRVYPLENGKIDFQSEARWHSEQIAVRGHVELTALSATVKYISDE